MINYKNSQSSCRIILCSAIDLIFFLSFYWSFIFSLDKQLHPETQKLQEVTRVCCIMLQNCLQIDGVFTKSSTETLAHMYSAFKTSDVYFWHNYTFFFWRRHLADGGSVICSAHVLFQSQLNKQPEYTQ